MDLPFVPKKRVAVVEVHGTMVPPFGRRSLSRCSSACVKTIALGRSCSTLTCPAVRRASPTTCTGVAEARPKEAGDLLCARHMCLGELLPRLRIVEDHFPAFGGRRKHWGHAYTPGDARAVEQDRHPRRSHHHGPYKGMGLPFRGMTPEEERKNQEMADRFFEHFVAVVAEGRHVASDVARGWASGEVWWASEALEMGLVDELGDLERATAYAAERAGIAEHVEQVRPQRPIAQKLLSQVAYTWTRAAGAEIERLLSARSQ